MYFKKKLVTKNEDSWLWHKCLGHIHFNLMNKIASKDLVGDLPKLKF